LCCSLALRVGVPPEKPRGVRLSHSSAHVVIDHCTEVQNTLRPAMTLLGVKYCVRDMSFYSFVSFVVGGGVRLSYFPAEQVIWRTGRGESLSLAPAGLKTISPRSQ
jgi:hypothetical protein